MSKTSSVYTRVEPEIKERAEQVLSRLGIPMSSAINLYLRQIIYHDGIPFEVKVPGHPLDISKMTEEEICAELEKAHESWKAGRTMTAEQLEENMRKYIEERKREK